MAKRSTISINGCAALRAYAYMRTCTRIRTCVHTYIRICVHTHTYIRTYVHTYIRTYVLGTYVHSIPVYTTLEYGIPRYSIHLEYHTISRYTDTYHIPVHTCIRICVYILLLVYDTYSKYIHTYAYAYAYVYTYILHTCICMYMVYHCIPQPYSNIPLPAIWYTYVYHTPV